jgi:predicted heme/steroid binding protein/uncharacterized membrane protein
MLINPKDMEWGGTVKKDELKSFDGKEGRSAYFAYKGKVYDVTGSKLWRNGTHVNRHHAGEDLTDFMSMAPHGDEVLEKCNAMVGEYDPDVVETVDRMDQLRALYRKFHPHPVTLHYPMGLFWFAAVMQLLFLVFQNDAFEKAAFYAFVGGTLTTFPAVASGIFSWWVNYQLTLTRIFRMKLIYSIVMIVFGVTGCILRFLYPEISYQTDPVAITYHAMVFLNVPALTIVALNGGKITWPS